MSLFDNRRNGYQLAELPNVSIDDARRVEIDDDSPQTVQSELNFIWWMHYLLKDIDDHIPPHSTLASPDLRNNLALTVKDDGAYKFLAFGIDPTYPNLITTPFLRSEDIMTDAQQYMVVLNRLRYKVGSQFLSYLAPHTSRRDFYAAFETKIPSSQAYQQQRFVYNHDEQTVIRIERNQRQRQQKLMVLKDGFIKGLTNKTNIVVTNKIDLTKPFSDICSTNVSLTANYTGKVLRSATAHGYYTTEPLQKIMYWWKETKDMVGLPQEINQLWQEHTTQLVRF